MVLGFYTFLETAVVLEQTYMIVVLDKEQGTKILLEVPTKSNKEQ